MTSELVFTLYTRDQCHLCEDLLQALEQYLGQRQYRIECIDIDTDQGLQQQYAGRIPVLCYQGKLVCEYFFDQAAVDACLNKYPPGR